MERDKKEKREAKNEIGVDLALGDGVVDICDGK